MADDLLKDKFWLQQELARQLGKTTDTILNWKAKRFTPPETILGARFYTENQPFWNTSGLTRGPRRKVVA